MTRQVVEQLQTKDPYSSSTLALNFVCSALIGHRGASGGSPYDPLDVERVFSAVQLLAARSNHEATPFSSAWQAGVEAFDQPSMPSFAGSNLKRAIDVALGGRFGDQDMD